MEGFLEGRHGRTWYRITGEGGRTPLVCLHGGPGSTHNYFRPLERLADERRIVLYDQLGCGRSDRAAPDWNLGIFTEELQQLRDHLDLDQIHLLGTSWGGMLALEHALGQPRSIRSLLLSSTLASAEEWVAEVRRLRDAIGGGDDDVLEEFERRHFFRGESEPLELARMREERSGLVYEAMWGPNEWTMTGALAGWDVRPRLRELTMPTLILRGEHSDVLPREAAEAMTQRGPKAQLVEFPNVGHAPMLMTDEQVRVVREFLLA